MRHLFCGVPCLLAGILIPLFFAPCVAQDLQLPVDFGIDLQLAEAGRLHALRGTTEITGTAANQLGDEVFHRLVAAGFSQPYPWKLTLVNNPSVNASSTAGGQIYVNGGLLPVIKENSGLWAAVLSHETAHTGRRHQVRVYMQELYIQKMVLYYRARSAAGDKSAGWALLGFRAASAIALQKLKRDQEHDADQQGMLLMARAGYHPDYVFALHHLLLMQTGERTKLGAFFSDHPRWETRDQRSDKVYADALAEYNRSWPEPESSPGGRPPVVAFLRTPDAKENKETGTADVSVPIYCRNATGPVGLAIVFEKDNRPLRAADTEYADSAGNLIFRQHVDCADKDEAMPALAKIPSFAVSGHDRTAKATLFVTNEGEIIAASKPFDVHFPKIKNK